MTLPSFLRGMICTPTTRGSRVEAGPLPVPEKDLHLNRLPRRPKERADSVGSSLGMGLLLRAVAVTKKAQLVVCQNKKVELKESLEDKRAKRLKRAQELKAHFESKLAK